MAATLGFDELNKPEFDSEAYIKEYFRPMQISEERKEEREEAAHSFLDVLLFILTLIATENAYNALDWDYIERQLRIELENAAREYARADQAMNDYIAEKAEDFIRVTQGKDLSDPYWTSEERATMEAVNEANDIVGYEEWQQAIDDGFEYKIWHTERDTKVRKTHQAVEGKKLPIKDMFEVGNGLMRYPHDWYYNPDECYNCRCSLDFSDKTGKVTKTGQKVQFTFDASDDTINFKKDIRDDAKKTEIKTLTNGEVETITASHLLGNRQNLYISDKFGQLKPKELNKVEGWIDQYLRMTYIKGAEMPRIVMVKDIEIGNLGGKYNCVTNTVIFKKVDSDIETKHNILHELFHWKDAQELISSGVKLTSNAMFKDIRSASCKRLLDKLGIYEKEAAVISDYAGQKYLEGRYDETYTEYRTVKELTK